MFYVAAKVIWFLAEPANFLIFVLFLCILLGVHRRWVRRVAAASALLLAATGLGPFGALLIRPLEERFSHPPAGAPEPDGILVLGGAIDDDLSLVHGETVFVDAAAARVTETLRLARLHPHARIAYIGGDGVLLGTARTSEAEAGRDLLLALGLDATRIIIEPKSRDTWENALLARAVIAPKPGEIWWLVTSAFHMPRAVGAFRMAEFPVVAYPVDHRTYGDARDLRISTHMAASWALLDVAVHEWVGLAAYRAGGRSASLFPAP